MLDYDNDNIFAKILRGELPCLKVYENEQTLAFMDIMPQANGHTLVIPKVAAITLSDLPDEAMLACMQTVRLVGQAVQKATGVNGFTVFQNNGKASGQTVLHVHFHILPGSLLGIKGHGVEREDPVVLQGMAARIIASIDEIL